MCLWRRNLVILSAGYGKRGVGQNFTGLIKISFLSIKSKIPFGQILFVNGISIDEIVIETKF